MLDFYVKTRIRFSFRDKRLFEITEVEITRVQLYLEHTLCCLLFYGPVISLPVWDGTSVSLNYGVIGLWHPINKKKLSLKVGSCPNNDKSVQFFFVLFCVAFKYFYFLNLFLPRKPQDFAENLPFFVCLFPLCWNFNSKNSFVTCP